MQTNLEQATDQEQAPSQEQVALIQARLQVENQIKGGAGWFYWIAALSIINTVISMLGGGWSFIVGLGATQFVDGFASALANDIGSGAATVVKVIAFAVDAAIAAIFTVFGIFGRKGYKWAFVVGMLLYALDGLLFVWIGDLLSIGFHLYALYGLYKGLKATRQLDDMEQSVSGLG